MALNEFSSGINTSLSTELNENFQQSIIRASASSEDTTEYSVSTNSSYSDIGYSKTFTVPDVGDNNILWGFKIVYDRKVNDSLDYAVLRMKVTNNTTGEVFYAFNDTTNYTNKAQSLGNFFNNTSYATSTEYVQANQLITAVGDGVYGLIPFDAAAFGSSYTITFEAKTLTGNDTAYMKNITITAYWSFLQDAETEGWA